MKLLFDATELSYYNDKSGHRAGVYNVALNLFKEFRKTGIDITLVSDYRRYYFLKEIEEFKNIELLPENSLINRFWGKLMYCTDKMPIRFKYALLILSRFYDALFCSLNKKNIKQLKGYDVYFSPYTPPSNEISKVGLKRFRMIHDTIPIVENGFPKSPKDWYYKIYSTVNDKDFYIANSVHTKKDILKCFSFVKDTNVQVALLGANHNFYPDKTITPVENKYVFSLCSLGKRKNIEFTIRNFFNFVEKNQIEDLKLVLGGAVWEKYKKELENIIDRYDRSKIILTGYIKDDDLKYYYSNAMMFVYPSLYEGFGLPVLEAMQCGCPVITSNSTSLPEVVGDTGILVNPNSDEEMIQAYEKMYFDDVFRNLCSQRAMERAKDFCWEKCAAEILDFIKSKL